MLGLYWGYIGLIYQLYQHFKLGVRVKGSGFRVFILVLSWGYIGVKLGLYWDNAK